MAGLWYRTGSVTVTQSSKKVTGSGTSWLTALNRPDKGNTFYGPDGKAYEIDYVTAEKEMYLVDAYVGANASAQSYKIDVRGGTVPELSRQLSEHYAYMQGIIDALQSIVSGSGDVTITGPSGQTVTVPALANMLSKSSVVSNANGATLADLRGKIPTFATTGDALLEVGSAVDMHALADPSSDFTVRLSAVGDHTLSISSSSPLGADVQVSGNISATHMFSANQGDAGNSVAQKMYVDRLRTDAAASFFPYTGGRVLGSMEVLGYLVKMGAGDFIVRDVYAAGNALHPDLRQAHFYNINGTLVIRSDMNADSDRIGNVHIQANNIVLDGAGAVDVYRAVLRDNLGNAVLNTFQGGVSVPQQFAYGGQVLPASPPSVIANPGAHAILAYLDPIGNQYGIALLQRIEGDANTYGTALFSSSENSRFILFSRAKIPNATAHGDFETHCWINTATGQINTDGDIYSNASIYSNVQSTAASAVARKDYVDSRTTSDLRLKRDLEPIGEALNKVESLRGLTFTKKDYSLGTESRMAGVIAQEVEAVLPEAVSEIGGSEDGIKTLDPLALCGLLVEAVKELRRELSDLRATVLQNQ